MIQTNGWTSLKKRLYRQALHRRMSELARQHLSFDAESNWTDGDRPRDIKAYWAGLTDTERAFERLQNTDAAVYMAFYEQIQRSMPEGVSMTHTSPIVVKPHK